MKIGRQARRLLIGCQETESIERILLRAYRHPLLLQALQEHAGSCKRCQKIVYRVTRFYTILSGELEKEPSPQAIEFVRKLETTQRR
jgi:hypothetical protein